VRTAQKISLLIPCFRQAHYLEEALASVTRQDWEDLEIIVADDASGDGAAQVMEPWLRRDPRIRFRQHPRNLGLTANWNWCLREARGQAIKLMGADDRLEAPDCLSLQWYALQKPGVALVASARQLIDEAGRPIRVERTLQAGRHKGNVVLDQMLKTQINLVGEPVAAMFWKHQAARGFDPAFRQLSDMELWFHLLAQGDLVYSAEPLVSFRTHARQESRRNWESGLSLEEHFRLLLREAAEPGRHPAARRAVALWTWSMSHHLPGETLQEFADPIKKLRARIGPVRFRLAVAGFLIRRLAARWGRSVRKRIPVWN